MIGGDYYLRKTLGKPGVELASIRNNDPIPAKVADSVKSVLGKYAEAYYETARYLLYHNKKNK
jgi:hypothetical protein